MRFKPFITGFMCVIAFASALQAQDTTKVPTGVELIGKYNVGTRKMIAVRPTTATANLQAVGQAVTAILQRDLTYSDRFEMGATPSMLVSGAIDYRAWNSLGVVFLVVPTVTQAGGGYQLRADLHDVVFGTVKASIIQALPAATASDFRMNVHAVSDEIVRQLTGQPGSAATRIAFIRKTGAYSSELVTVESDGENVQRVLADANLIYSPTWSPDGKRIAYSIRLPNTRVELRERDLVTNRDRIISSRPQFSYAPSYSPDGKKLAFTVTVGDIAQEVDEYDLVRNCCLKRLSRGPRDDLNPSYSPDGQRIAFNSSRLGQLHVYVMPAGGGEATLISPYTYGERGEFAAPDWSPVSDEIAFTGRSRGDLFQIMIARAGRPGVAQQLTTSGRNEDPSWAPDGRHIVYTGVGREGSGLYIIDIQSGTIRRLISGSKLQMADWSPALLAVPH